MIELSLPATASWCLVEASKVHRLSHNCSPTIKRVALAGQPLSGQYRWPNAESNMEEFLIAKVAEYPPLAIPIVVAEDRTQAYDVTPAYVKLLAP